MSPGRKSANSTLQLEHEALRKEKYRQIKLHMSATTSEAFYFFFPEIEQLA